MAVSALLAGIVVPLLALPASAIPPGQAFTSANLPTWQTNGVAWAVAMAQGKAFVGGTFSSVRPPGAPAGTGEVAVANFVTLDAATGQPTGCSPKFTLPSNPSLATVRSLAVSPDGQTLYVGGYFSTVDGIPDQHLAAIDIATCKVITAFKPKPNGYVYAIAANSTAVYYAGGFSQAGGASRTRAAAASAVGTASPGALLPWAPTFNGDVFALGLNPDGSSVAAGGAFTNVSGTSLNALVVVDSAGGAIVATFPGLVPPPVRVKAIAVDATSFYEAQEHRGGSTENRTAIDWSNYHVRWTDSCQGANQAVTVFKGVLYSGSHAHNCSSMGWFPDESRHHLLAESTSDDSLVPWMPDTDDGIGEHIGPRGLAAATTASGDFLFVVGEFTTVNDVPQQGITRFGGPPDTVVPSLPLVSVTSPAAGQARVSWRSSVDTDDSLLTYQVFRDGSDTPIYTTTGTSWLWQRPQLDFIDTGLDAGSTVRYRVSASDGTNTTMSAQRNVTVAGGSSAYADRVIADGSNMYWRYDDPADVFVSDASSFDRNGTLQGGATWGQPGAIVGDPSTAITVDGTGTTVYNEQRLPSPTTYSLETWFRTTTTSGGKIIGFGDKQTFPSANNDKNLYMANDGTLIFGVFPGSVVTLRSPRSYNDGQWHYVVATQGPSGMGLYVDGARVGQNGTTGNQNFMGYWHVGGDSLGGWPSQPSSPYFRGTLDETAVYPTALSAATVAAHYTLGTGLTPSPGPNDYYGHTVFADSPSLYWRLGEASGNTALDGSGNGNTGTYTSGVNLGRPSLVSGTTDTAAAFSGSPTVGAANSVSSPSVFSIEAWFSTSTTSGGKIIGFGSSRSGNSSTFDRHVYMLNDGRLTFGVLRNDGTRVAITSTSSYNDGRAHHVVATFGSSGMVLYVDGAQVASNNTAMTPLSYSGFWRAGGDRLSNWPNRPNNDFFSGTIDEFAVYPVVLTGSVVALHSSAGRTTGTDVAPPTTPNGLTGSLSSGGVDLHWTASSDNVGVTRYEVYRSTVNGFTPSPATLIGTPGSTNFTDSTAPAGTQYYRVIAVDAAGNHSGASPQFALTVVDSIPPSDPTGVSATANGASVDVSWNAATDNIGVVDYTVHRSGNSGFTPSAANRVATTSSTSVTDTPPGSGRWYYRVVARDAAGNTSAGASEAFADIADNTPPTAPTGLTATGGTGQITLHWTAATDDSGAVTYAIYRSTTTGFTPDASTRVGTANGTSFVDSPLSVGRWYYRVLAVDGSGNIGPASDEAFADSALPPPTVIAVTSSADTYANQGAPSTNFGTSASLFSRGSPGGISYLRFVLPAAPAGKQLIGATLQFRTTTDSTAGSTNSHTVQFADDGWNESTLTWNNHPALNGAPLGTITDATAVNTLYTTTLDSSRLIAALGSQISLGITGAGSDGLWFWSMNHPSAAFRPQLLLSFQ